jgi:hypothetical protein
MTQNHAVFSQREAARTASSAFHAAYNLYNFTTRAASKVSEAAAAGTAALTSAVHSVTPGSSSIISAEQASRIQDYRSLIGAPEDGCGGGIANLSDAQSLTDSSEGPSGFESFEEVDVSKPELSPEEKRRWEEMLRKRREDEEVNELIDQLDEIFEPTVLKVMAAPGGGGAGRREKG